MSCSCKGYCNRQKAESVKGFSKGQKYCSICRIYITTPNLFCNCCKRKYRTKKRSRWNQIAPKIQLLTLTT